MNYVICMSYTDKVVRIIHTDYIIRMIYMDHLICITHTYYVIWMYYTKSIKHEAAINEEQESLPQRQKWHNDGGDILKADNGSNQRRQHDTNQGRGSKKTKEEDETKRDNDAGTDEEEEQ